MVKNVLLHCYIMTFIHSYYSHSGMHLVTNDLNLFQLLNITALISEDDIQQSINMLISIIRIKLLSLILNDPSFYNRTGIVNERTSSNLSKSCVKLCANWLTFGTCTFQTTLSADKKWSVLKIWGQNKWVFTEAEKSWGNLVCILVFITYQWSEVWMHFDPLD